MSIPPVQGVRVGTHFASGRVNSERPTWGGIIHLYTMAMGLEGVKKLQWKGGGRIRGRAGDGIERQSGNEGSGNCH